MTSSLVTDITPVSEPETVDRNDTSESHDQKPKQDEEQKSQVECSTAAQCVEDQGKVMESRDSHVTQDWTSVGVWQCPQLRYRQDEESVSFVLCTPAAKKNSVVTHFQQESVSFSNRNDTTTHAHIHVLTHKYLHKFILAVHYVSSCE